MNPQNLTPWKPGQTGNPGGRPKKRPVTDEYALILSEKLPEVLRKQINGLFGTEFLKKGATFARAQALRRALDAMLEGGFQASREMREAIEGKASSSSDIENRPEFSVIVINGASRPDWAKMKRVKEVIPGLPIPPPQK